MMGVQYMQAESLYSQLLQVGNLVHIGQHEARHSWKLAASAGEHHQGAHYNGAAGYFKSLLAEGELEPEAVSICSDHHANYNINNMHAEDSKPLIMRSLEINASQKLNMPINANTVNAAGANAGSGAGAAINSSSGTKLAAHSAISPPPNNCPDSKPSSSAIISPLKRARETTNHKEQGGGGVVAGKREKKGLSCSREEGKDQKQGKLKTAPAPAPAVALAGRKSASSVKPKAPKPAPAALQEQPPRTDYVHVRARRGQATDSHSLAERVRREKISERMRFLQDLVPGCSKITGKALILDEIINYVQSLQNQVEFLAMRLAAMNPKIEHASLRDCADEEIASPFVEEVRECSGMHPKALTMHTPNSDLPFDSLPTFYSGLFDDSNFNSSIVSDLSTSTCNDSHLTSMDFSHLG